MPNHYLSLVLIAAIGLLTVSQILSATEGNKNLNLEQPLVIIPTGQDVIVEWERFKHTYKKSYSFFEESYRYSVFQSTVFFIANTQPQLTFTIGITQFSDMTDLEFEALYLTTISEKHQNTNPILTEEQLQAIPDSVDWVAKGQVGYVEDQGKCGSGYAFASVNSIESAFSVYRGTNIILSKGQVVQCSGKSNNLGCNGGYISKSYEYVMNYPLNIATSYSYTSGSGVQGLCNSQLEQQGKYKITNYFVYSNSDGDCNTLKANLAKQPTVVSVDAGYFKYYQSGIFNKCSQYTNYATLLVGYDSDSWTIKPSLGTDWGEGGYIRIAPGNSCGICSSYGSPSV